MAALSDQNFVVSNSVRRRTYVSSVNKCYVNSRIACGSEIFDLLIVPAGIDWVIVLFLFRNLACLHEALLQR